MKNTHQNPLSPWRLIEAKAINSSLFIESQSSRVKLMRSAAVIAISCASALAAPLLTPGDPVFAYDLDTAGGSTGGATYQAVNYPGGESPAQAIDGNSGTKYLNFSKHNAGIIVTPTTAAAAQSLVLTTANDSAERDPSSYIILGSNHPITGADKSNGFTDNWTFIAQGTLSLPSNRLTTATAINFTNATSYSSYWIVFPTTKDNVANNNLMQIAEIQLFTGTGGTGSAIFSPGNPTRATGWNSSIANGEFVSRVIDGNLSTKYLNFGENNSGFYVVPSTGPSIIDSFQLHTANDSDNRDPATWTLHGMAPGGIWSQIDTGSVSLPTARNTPGPIVTVSNTNVYVAYRMTFNTVRNSATANSMQVAEAQFFGTIVPANDSDSDLMDDDWETLYGLIVGTNDAASDLDADGSPNLQEYQRGTLPNSQDTDGDGLFDGVETDTAVFVSASDTGTSPLDTDSDDDTYTDSYEVAKGTDPNSPGDVPTITWDITPGASGEGDGLVSGGSGDWDQLTTGNWTIDSGNNNIVWDNGGLRLAAIFGGTSGSVALTNPITADRVIVNTDGYVFSGEVLTLGSSAPVINITTGTTEMSQVIAGSAGFTKQGNGTLRLAGTSSNTYTGITSLKGLGKIVLAKAPGEIAIPGDLFLDSSAFVQNTSGLVLAGDEQIADTSVVTWANVGQADTYFRLNGYAETVGGLVSDGVGGFVVIENRGFNDTTVYPDGELIINTTGSNTYGYNGNIRNIDGGTNGGTVSITKDGTGTQILSGNMSYSGATTVLGGTLQLGNNLPSSYVSVEAGGTLSGTATLGQGPFVNVGGSISPGVNGIGTLTTANTIIDGTYVCQIDGASADRLTANGTLDIDGGTLQLSVINAPTADSYILASHGGALTGEFTVVGLPAGYTVSYDSGSGQIRLVKGGFSSWATQLGLTGNAGDDFDKDGLPDAVEYVLGTDPLTSNADGPVGDVVGDDFIFTFERDKDSMTPDIAISIEVGTDLVVWDEIYQVGADTAASSEGVRVTGNGTSDTITLTVPKAPDDEKFARLRVTVVE
jgi:autotransporter-associated beta strand protein